MARAFDIIIKPSKKNITSSHSPGSHPKTSAWFFFALLIIIFLIMADFSNKPASEQESNEVSQTNSNQNQQVLGDNTSSQDLEKSIYPEQSRGVKSENTDVITESSETLQPTAEQKTPAAEIPQSEINKSAIKMRILNGAGIAGVANSTKKKLEEQGFTIESIGTARNLYQQTTIYYNKDKKESAVLVQLALGEQDIHLQENPTLTGDYDLLVVIGKEG